MSGAQSFSWRCERFAALTETKLYSPVFTLGSYQWRLLVFPRGLRTHNDISVFVDVADADTQPPRWRRDARFTLTLVNHLSASKSIKRDGSHGFCAAERDRGFTELTENRREEVLDPAQGFLDKEGALEFACDVEVLWDGREEADDDSDGEAEVRVDWRYDSKAATGFVGLANQGATCYLNSLVQSLYHLPAFRALVFGLESSSAAPSASPSASASSPTVVRALQRLFFRLAQSPRAVETLELTRSFGWTSADAFVQHDVQELLRVLNDRLEQSSAHAKDALAQLFRGQLENRIVCTKVAYETARREDFYDVSLNVKGANSLEAALAQFTEDELLNGENLYRAPEPHGLQEARKGIRFSALPPVLHLHLKRFELDPYGDGYVKVCDRQSYPLELDLTPYLAPDARADTKAPPPRYHLHGVLVHRGHVSSGHYYAFLRPTADAQWYKFDDATVVKTPQKRALQDNFGLVGFGAERAATAYMLIYLRDAERASLLDARPLPDALKNALAEDDRKEEAAAKAREEQRSQLELVWVDDDILSAHRGADLAAPSAAHRTRVPKDAELRALKDTLLVQTQLSTRSAQAEEAGAASAGLGALAAAQAEVRVWDWVRRQNKSQRPDAPFSSSQLALPLRALDLTDGALWVWLERAPLAPVKRADALIFVKWFEPATRTLRLIGRIPLPTTAKLSVMADYARKEMHVDAATAIALWEEVSARRCDALKLESSLDDAELGTGDIVIAQRSEKAETAKEYLLYLRKRRQIKCLPRGPDNADEGALTIEARTDRPLAEVARSIAAQLKLSDASGESVLLSGAHVDESADTPSAHPRTVPHDFTHADTLKQAAKSTRSTPDLIYYERLPEGITRTSLANKEHVRVHVYCREHAHDTLSAMSTRILYARRDVSLGSLLEPLGPSLSGSGALQLLAVREGRLLAVYSAAQSCADLEARALVHPDVLWIAERAPVPRAADAQALLCVHVRPPSSLSLTLKCWGLPFFLSLARNDTVAEVLEALKQRLAAHKADAAQWKLARLDLRRDALEGVVTSEAASTMTSAGSAWTLWEASSAALAVLHYAPDKDAHNSAVKIK